MKWLAWLTFMWWSNVQFHLIISCLHVEMKWICAKWKLLLKSAQKSCLQSSVTILSYLKSILAKRTASNQLSYLKIFTNETASISSFLFPLFMSTNDIDLGFQVHMTTYFLFKPLKSYRRALLLFNGSLYFDLLIAINAW